MSALLAEMLRKSTQIYNDRWVEQTKSDYNAAPRPETVAQHNTCIGMRSCARWKPPSSTNSWASRGKRAASNLARAGTLADAVGRTVEATNLIELAILEANDGVIPPIEIINEVAELRSMIVMAVVEGYKEDQDAQRHRESSEPDAKQELRDVMLRPNAYEAIVLASGDEISPLYEGGMKFHFVDYGKLRLYNLLPNGRSITVSIFGPGDIFLQWRTEAQSLSCLCAEAMQSIRASSAVSEAEMADHARRPAAGRSRRDQYFRAAHDRIASPDRRPHEQQRQPAALSHAARAFQAIRQTRGRRTV